MGKEICFQNPEICNFRDFGGYQTQSGLYVKEGIFYRSGALGLIQKEDREKFLSLNIQTIFDLRSEKERNAFLDPDFSIQAYHMSAIKDEKGHDIDFSPKHILSFSHLLHIHKQPHHTYLQTYFAYFYSKILFHNPVVQKIFDCLLEEKTPLLIHCSAGKDRTGIIAALILLALGVDRETVMYDYLNSNYYRHDVIEKWLDQYHYLVSRFSIVRKIGYLIQGVIEETLLLCFELIDQKYQSFEDYLFYEYGLTQHLILKLQKMYLEKMDD